MSTVTAESTLSEQLIRLIVCMQDDGSILNLEAMQELADSPHDVVRRLYNFMEQHEQQTYQLRKTARDLKYLKSFGNRLAYACDLAIEDIGRRL